MGRTQSYIGTPNGVVMCVDQVMEGQCTGRLYHGYSEEPILFSTKEEELQELEQFYDSIQFPHPSMNERTFLKTKSTEYREEKREKMMSDEELLKKHGELGTFIIRVQHRQNSTWQGRLTWVEEDRTENFRSIWEMIKLIDGALDAVGAPNDAADAAEDGTTDSAETTLP